MQFLRLYLQMLVGHYSSNIHCLHHICHRYNNEYSNPRVLKSNITKWNLELPMYYLYMNPFFCSIITDIWLLKPNLDLYQKNPKDLQPIFNPNQLHSCAEYVQFCSFSIQGHNRLLLEKVRVLGINHIPQSKYYGLGKNHH